MPPPNILFIITDQQQAIMVDPTHPCRMANLRALASDGIRFERAYTPCPICVPARVSLMSGVYPHTHGLLDNSNLPGGIVLAQKNQPERNVFGKHPLEGLPCFSQDLQQAGYRVGWTGRWHVFPGHHPSEIGFEWFDHTEADYSKYRDSLGLKEGIYSPQRLVSGKCLGNPGFSKQPLYGKHNDPVESELDFFTTEKALARLEALGDSEAPWFMGVGLIAPHDPYVIPEPYASMYDPDSIDLPANFHDTSKDKPNLYRKQWERAYGELTERNYREMIACYWGFNTFADDMIGRIMSKLEDLGMRDNTLVVLTSDHGDNMGAHRLIFKSLSMYEETLRIPMVMRWPKGISNPGRVHQGLVSLLDIAPTVLDVAGIGIPEHLHGYSLKPWLSGEPESWRSALLVESEGVGGNHLTQRVLISDRWKYVYNGFDVDELYDLSEDPHELVNLAGQESSKETLYHMMKSLWQEITRTQGLTSLPPMYRNVLLPFGPGGSSS